MKCALHGAVVVSRLALLLPPVCKWRRCPAGEPLGGNTGHLQVALYQHCALGIRQQDLELLHMGSWEPVTDLASSASSKTENVSLGFHSFCLSVTCAVEFVSMINHRTTFKLFNFRMQQKRYYYILNVIRHDGTFFIDESVSNYNSIIFSQETEIRSGTNTSHRNSAVTLEGWYQLSEH